MPVLYGQNELPPELLKALQGGFVKKLDTRSMRMDAASTVIFKPALEEFLANILESKRPPLNFSLLAPTNTTWMDWDDFTGYRMQDGVAKPEPLRGSGKDMPLAGLSGKERKNRVETFAIGAGWTLQELQKAAQAAAQGLAPNLDTSYLSLMERGCNELANDLGIYGDRDLKIQGLLNNPDVKDTAFEDSTGTAVTVNDNSTITQIKSAFGQIINRTLLDTNTSFVTNRLGICKDAYVYLTETQSSTASDVNLLQWLQKNYPAVQFLLMNELSLNYKSLPFGTTGQVNDDYIVATDSNMEGFGQAMPMAWTLFDLWQNGPFSWILPSLIRIGSVHAPYPAGIQVANNVLGRRVVTGS